MSSRKPDSDTWKRQAGSILNARWIGSTMRIGVIGYGAVAAVHVKGLHGWGADLHTIFGPEPREPEPLQTRIMCQIQRRRWTNCWTSATRRLLPRPAVATSNRRRLRYVPAGLSWWSCPHVSPLRNPSGALASAAERTLQCAHTTRFLSGILRLENWVKSGLLGDIRHVISMRAIPPRRRSWIDDAILHHAAHHIDLLLHWFGDVTPVASVAHPRIEGAQDAALVARLQRRPC